MRSNKLIFTFLGIALIGMLIFSACQSEPTTGEEEPQEESGQEIQQEALTTHPYEAGSVKYNVRVPDFYAYQGELIQCVRWSDLNGENMVILTEKPATDNGQDQRSTSLFAYHYAERGTVVNYHQFEDVLDSCFCDCNFLLLSDSIQVMDANNDKIAEVLFLIGRNDRCDVSPLTSVLHMWTGEDALRIDGYTDLWTTGGTLPDSSAPYQLADGNSIMDQSLIDAATSFWEAYEAANTGPERE